MHVPVPPQAAAPTPGEPASPPCLLALDTATETTHIALELHGSVHAAAKAGGAQSSAVLLPALQQLLQVAGAGWPQVDAIAFGRGPGAFTGLRTATSVAQGLAFGLGKPVIVLDTLMAVAEDARMAGADAGCVWVANDARMGELYAAVYAHDAQRGWQVLREPALHTPAAWLEQLQGATGTETPSACAGNAWHALGEALEAAARSAPVWPDARPTGAALLALARHAWAAGALQDAASALPLYVRDKVAQTTAEREAARAAKAQAA